MRSLTNEGTYKCNVIERNCTKEIYRESTFHIFACYDFTISYLFTAIVI